MATTKLLLLPGDGIGPEVMGEVKKLIAWMNGHGMGTFDTEEGSESDPNATPSYEFTSARIAYTPKGGRWNVALSCQNLLDEKISYGRWSLGGFYGGTGTDPQQEMRARPRTLNASFRYNF